MSLETANLSISITAAELDLHFAQGPLFSKAKIPPPYRSNGPIIIRSDPDEDALALVDKLKRDFPREFEMVGFPADQDIHLVDLRPYFEEDEIQKHGTNILRWVLLRISSLNSYRLNQIRRLGWEWKEANQSAFERCNYFTAEILRQFGMEDNANGEFLEPIASFLNNLRYHYFCEAAKDQTQEECCLPTPVAQPSSTPPSFYVQNTDESTHGARDSMNKPTQSAPAAEQGKPEPKKNLSGCIAEPFSASLQIVPHEQSSGTIPADKERGLDQSWNGRMHLVSNKEKTPFNDRLSYSNPQTHERFGDEMWAMDLNRSLEMNPMGKRDTHAHNRSSSTALGSKNFGGKPTKKSYVDQDFNTDRTYNRHHRNSSHRVYSKRIGEGKFLPIQVYSAPFMHAHPMLRMPPTHHDMHIGFVPFATTQIPGLAAQTYDGMSQFYHTDEELAKRGIHGIHSPSASFNPALHRNNFGQHSKLPPRKTFSDDVRRSRSDEFAAAYANRGSVDGYRRDGAEMKNASWHKLFHPEVRRHQHDPGNAGQPGSEHSKSAKTVHHRHVASNESKNHTDCTQKLPLKPPAGCDAFLTTVVHPKQIERIDSRSTISSQGPFHHSRQVNASHAHNEEKDPRNVPVHSECMPFRSDGYERDFTKLFVRSDINNPDVVRHQIQSIPGFISSSFRGFKNDQNAITISFLNEHYATLAFRYFISLRKEGNPLIRSVEYGHLWTKQPDIPVKRRQSVQKPSPSHTSRRPSVKSNETRSRCGSTPNPLPDYAKDSGYSFGGGKPHHGAQIARVDHEFSGAGNPVRPETVKTGHAGSTQATIDGELEEANKGLSSKQSDSISDSNKNCPQVPAPAEKARPTEDDAGHGTHLGAKKYSKGSFTGKDVSMGASIDRERIGRRSSASSAKSSETRSYGHRNPAAGPAKTQSIPRLPQKPNPDNSSPGFHKFDEKNFPTLAEASKMVASKGSMKGRSGNQNKERATVATKSLPPIKTTTFHGRLHQPDKPSEKMTPGNDENTSSKPCVKHNDPGEAESLPLARPESASHHVTLSYASKLAANLQVSKEAPQDEAGAPMSDDSGRKGQIQSNYENTESSRVSCEAVVADPAQTCKADDGNTTESLSQSPHTKHCIHVDGTLDRIAVTENATWQPLTAVTPVDDDSTSQSRPMAMAPISTHKKKKKTHSMKLRSSVGGSADDLHDKVVSATASDTCAPSSVNRTEVGNYEFTDDHTNSPCSDSVLTATPSEESQGQPTPTSPTDSASTGSEQTHHGHLPSPRTPTRSRAQPRPGQGRSKKNKTKQKASSKPTPASHGEHINPPSMGQSKPLSSPYSMKEPGISESIELGHKRQPLGPIKEQPKEARLVISTNATKQDQDNEDTANGKDGRPSGRKQELNWTNRTTSDERPVSIQADSNGFVLTFGKDQHKSSARLIRRGGIDYLEGTKQGSGEPGQDGKASNDCELDALLDAAGIQSYRGRKMEIEPHHRRSASSERREASGQEIQKRQRKERIEADGYTLKGG